MISVRDYLTSQWTRYAMVLFTTVLIVVFSVLGSEPTMDPAAICDQPGVICLTTGPFGLIGADKWIHGIAYAVLMATLASAFVTPVRSDRHNRLVLSFCLAVLLGLCLEFVQGPLPGRSTEGLDFLANTIGAGLVALLWYKRMDTVRLDSETVHRS